MIEARSPAKPCGSTVAVNDLNFCGEQRRH
jgi:hypothetical protein